MAAKRIRTKGKHDTLKAFTERAMECVDAAREISPIVYLPRKLRGNKMIVHADDVRVSITPPDIAGNHLRIAQADPLGFLIAIMNGQPIPAFHIAETGSVRVEYHVPEMEERRDVAKWLATRVTYTPYRGDKPNPTTGNAAKKQAHNAEYNALINNRANKDGVLEEHGED